ncbi:MAG: hypothetical protein IKH27_15510 [Oscillospiraceae bacterium]|nr:hypothetical protein [Oscillospiraceae bacterium]
MKRKAPALALILGSMLMFNGCGNPGSSDSEPEMIYVKSVSLYDTISDIYADPDAYLGKQYHMVGTLYPSTDDSGSKFYSIYAKSSGTGPGIGLELDWDDYSGFADNEKVTVEGTLEKQMRSLHGVRGDYIVLKVSLLEKRE